MFLGLLAGTASPVAAGTAGLLTSVSKNLRLAVTKKDLSASTARSAGTWQVSVPRNVASAEGIVVGVFLLGRVCGLLFVSQEDVRKVKGATANQLSPHGVQVRSTLLGKIRTFGWLSGRHAGAGNKHVGVVCKSDVARPCADLMNGSGVV